MERYNAERLPGRHHKRRQVATPMQIDGAVAVVKRSSSRVQRLERPMAQLQLHQADAVMESDTEAVAVEQEQETEANVEQLQLPSMPVLQDSDVEINERHRHKHKSKSKSKSKKDKEKKEKKAKKHDKKKLRQLLLEEQVQGQVQGEALQLESTAVCEHPKIGDISTVRWVNQKKRILEQWQREHGSKKRSSKKHRSHNDNDKYADNKNDRK